MAPESLNESEESANELLEIPECVFYRENVFKGRWSRGWFHQLRWIHLKVDVKMKDDGSTQACFWLVDVSDNPIDWFHLTNRIETLKENEFTFITRNSYDWFKKGFLIRKCSLVPQKMLSSATYKTVERDLAPGATIKYKDFVQKDFITVPTYNFYLFMNCWKDDLGENGLGIIFSS